MELASRPEVLTLSADILKSIESNALQLSSSFEALTSTSGKVRTALQNITLATYNSISKAARQGVDIIGRRYFWDALWSNNKISADYHVIAWYSEPDKDGTISEFRWRGGAITTSLVSTRQFWVNISYAARNRYKRSACISLAAIDSFIRHLEDGGEESGTGRFILVEDFDESTFELGPRVI
ncbi:hypothetical protein BD410DRAFT_515740 [Rickenella mellea]|uniref:Uncharacterized protein n=1 Tax=Rickenella mellea TaxID=50990 RepID=A0A4Y7PS58_9AGAM|nr:hypothetical protein BD410DRAFT_515740 [Rickenella mellea]